MFEDALCSIPIKAEIDTVFDLIWDDEPDAPVALAALGASVRSKQSRVIDMRNRKEEKEVLLGLARRPPPPRCSH